MSLYLGDIPIANDGLQRLTGEIGDIGIAPFGIDESLNLRRYLNGQVISQTQFEAFTNKVKSAIALYPNLAATEENWQAEVTASVLGQCGKFVVDDEAGTIRLPKVVNINGLQDLALIGGIKAESLPNIKGDASLGAAGQNSLIVGHWSGSGFFSTRETTDGPVVSSGGTTTGATHRILTADASRSSTAYQDGAPVQQEAIQYPYYIQVATGIEETLPAIREYGINTPFFFGWSMYSENAPYNASLLASQGQYNASNLYPDLWTQLTGVELNTSLNVGDTIEISGKTYVKRGLPVVLSTGTITDYDFVVNQNDQTFRLPLLNGSEDLPGEKVIDYDLKASGGTYDIPFNGRFTALFNVSGAYSSMNVAVNGKLLNTLYAAGSIILGDTFDVKRGDVVTVAYAQASGTPTKNRLQLTCSTGNGTLYYYVGDVVQDASLINTGAVLSDVVDLKQTTLRTNQITNCITEIPQDIKLELNNGVLTLKAGSKIYMPNGFEEDGTTPKFDVVTIENDVVREGWGGWDRTDLIWMRCDEVNTYTSLPPAYCFSGETAPTSFISNGAFWYDTVNNICKLTTDNGATWAEARYSLPFGIITFGTSGNGVTSIDQVFNGFGYIGSTVFALPGVKGLIPNGRNADGTLKNIEFTTDSVWLGQTAYNTNKATLGVVSDMKALVYVTDANVGYDDSDNKNKIVSNGTYWEGCFAGAVSVSNMKFTSVKPKLPFRAVDRNDSSWISAQAMPSSKYIDLTLLASASNYTAPANGWVYIRKKASAVNQYLVIHKYLNTGTSYEACVMWSQSTTADLYVHAPVLKGEKFTVNYTADGTSSSSFFRFHYAEGETNV